MYSSQIAAFRTAQMSILTSDAYSAETKNKVRYLADCVIDALKREDRAAADRTINTALRDGEAMDHILDGVFCALQIDVREKLF